MFFNWFIIWLKKAFSGYKKPEHILYAIIVVRDLVRPLLIAVSYGAA
jgi:hypothetical protein